MSEPSENVRALIGLKDVRVMHYQRCGADVELMIEQVVDEVQCPTCGGPARVKERPVVRYVDLPVCGTPMHLACRKHALPCRRVSAANVRARRPSDCREGLSLTTQAAKWTTVQVDGGRTVSGVAADLTCDWHTVNDAVMVYGQALLAADRRRLNKTTVIGLVETSFVRPADQHTS